MNDCTCRNFHLGETSENSQWAGHIGHTGDSLSSYLCALQILWLQEGKQKWLNCSAGLRKNNLKLATEERQMWSFVAGAAKENKLRQWVGQKHLNCTCTQTHLLTTQCPGCPCGFANKSWSPFIFHFQMIAALDTFRSLILRQRIRIFLTSLDLVLMLPNFPSQG